MGQILIKEGLAPVCLWTSRLPAEAVLVQVNAPFRDPSSYKVLAVSL